MLSKHKYMLVNCSGLPTFVNWKNRKRLLVLTYHGLYDGPRDQLPLPETFVHIEDMASQLSFITKQYKIISPEDLISYIDGECLIPDHAAMITFDDGYESFYRLAAPILHSMKIKAVVFISTAYVEERKPFWFDAAWWLLNYGPSAKIRWVKEYLGAEEVPGDAGVRECIEKMKNLSLIRRSAVMTEIETCLNGARKDDPRIKLFYGLTPNQVREAGRYGVRIGGHTHSHSILANLPKAEAEEEIRLNKSKIEIITGKQCLYFAYPNGASKDFTEAHQKTLQQSGYRVGFSLTEERSFPHRDPMNVSRINVGPHDNLRSLKFRSSGIMPFLSRVKARLIR
jgi:peptidoglycan/xylan/chitin deacetylase (PgdA/CDA1 family)